MSVFTRCRLIAFGVVVLLLLPASLLAQQGTVSTTGGSGAPGGTFQIPVALVMGTGGNGQPLTIDLVEFAVKITPNGSAPALTGSLGFTQDASLPQPFVDSAAAPNIISVDWLVPFNPAVSGTKTLGVVTMIIPSGAANGQTYTIAVSGAQGTSGSAARTLAAGPDSTLTVNAPPPPPPPPASPVLAVSTAALTFTGLQGATSPASQTATISNTGGGTLSWNAAVTSGAWLSVSPASGTGAGTLTISANIAGLTANTYSGAIQVSAIGANNSPQTINVTLTLTAPVAPPVLALSPGALAFTAQQGGTNPASQTLAIANSGSGTLTWTAVAVSSPWLNVSAPSGTGASTLAISTNITGMSAGTYNGAILVAATGATNTPQTINVTLTIAPPAPVPVIALNPASFTFTAQQGGANPANQTVPLVNSGAGTLNWTASVTNGAWLTVSPTSGTGPATLTLAANIAGLNPGSYSGAIQVAATGASNTPQKLNVTLTVIQSAASAISLTPSSLQFVATAGTNPSTQSFQVLNNLTGALGWTATANTLVGSNWLSVSPTAGVAPSTLTVSVASSSLAKGIYLGNITISALVSANALNSPQSILVALAVDAPVIGQNGIVEGAGFSAVVSPGGIASLFGTNLAPSMASAAAVPLPTTLANTQVLVNGVPAPLFYVSPTQINFQMPAEPAGASVAVTVQSGGITSLSETVSVAAAGPGIFTATSDGKGQGAVLNQDYSANSAQNPAAAGSVIQIFATGLGLTNPPVSPGQPGATSPPLNMTVNTPAVTIAGVPAQVLFSGLAPGFVGLYQVNVQVPSGIPSGSASLQIQISGQTSNQATVAVR